MKYWYKITTYKCKICGKKDKIREKVFVEKEAVKSQKETFCIPHC